MVGLSPLLLRGRAQHYDWGSLRAIPELLGEEPDRRPWAELWFGAHPAAPADALVGGEWRPLNVLVAAEPEAHLGGACLAAFGPRLPFLVKVLAAEQPLSLQVHPTPAQAEAGFAREEKRRVPLDSPRRTYKDPWHKPELICAVTPFVALSGFRPPKEAARVLAAFGLDDLAGRVRAEGLEAAFWSLWEVPAADRRQLVAAVKAGLARGRSGFAAERDLLRRLLPLHPRDVGVVGALMLNLVTLAPDEALYAPAGRLHAYVFGVGVEVMATSDNVVRGGLTKKHVDRKELRRVLRVEPEVVEPLPEGPGGWPTPAPEFHLSRLRPRVPVEVAGPEVLLAMDGPVTVDGVTAGRGGALFVPAALGSYELVGDSPAYRCRAGLVVR